MFDGLWPGFDDAEVPITLGHQRRARPDLGRPPARRAWPRSTLGTERDRATAPAGQRVGDVPRRRAVGRAPRAARPARRRRPGAACARPGGSRGASPAELGWVDDVLDPDVLTIGFARRVPTYKRLTLMLRDPDRLRALLLRPRAARSSSSSPASRTRPTTRASGSSSSSSGSPTTADVRHRIVFLPNYDIAMAQTLYPGCDVWLNNPLRPLEACGTSGMKAALNGGLNLSILDGWWDEWFDGENGWAIPTADGVDDPDRRDDLEAAALYDLIEHAGRAAVLRPRRRAACRAAGCEMVRHTLGTLGPKVLATRMVGDYVAAAVRAGGAGRHARSTGRATTAPRSSRRGRRRCARGWSAVRVDHVESSGVGDSPQVGDVLHGQRVRLARRPATRRRRGRRSCTAACHDADELDRDRRRRCSSTPRPTRTAGTGSPATSRLRRTGAFGYTVRVLPAARRPGQHRRDRARRQRLTRSVPAALSVR